MDVIGVGSSIAAFLLYYNTLDAGFVYDDRRAILNNQDILSTSPLSGVWQNDFWGTPLSNSGSHGSYRPLCTLTFRLNYLLAGGFRPFGFHLVNVLLHSLCTYLVVKLARVLLRGTFPVLICGALFSVHPIHTEAVAGIVGRADIISCVFYLVSFLSYVKHVKYRTWLSGGKIIESGSETSLWFQCIGYLILCLLTCAAAMLSKETGLTVLLLCGLYDLMLNCRSIRQLFTKQRHRAQLASLCTLGFVLFGLLLVRLLMMGARPPHFASSDNPSSRCPSGLTRSLTFLYLPLFNIFLLICPVWLSFDWSMDAIPLVTTLSDARNLLTLAFYHVAFRIVRDYTVRLPNRSKTTRRYESTKCPVCKALTSNGHVKINHNNNISTLVKVHYSHNVYRHAYSGRCSCSSCLKVSLSSPSLNFSSGDPSAPTVLLALAFLAVPFLPATNLFFYVGFVVAERVLYISSVGFCLLVSFGCNVLYRKTNRKAVIQCAIGILLLTMSMRTVVRNRDWHNEETLYRSGIPINPPKAYGNLGSILNAQGRGDEAEKAYKMALKYRPNMADVHYNLGVLLQSREQLDEAISSYRSAIQYRPSLALAYLNLGQLLASLGRCEEAAAIFRQCSQLDSTGLKDQRQHEVTRTSALVHLGRLLADQGRNHRAVAVYLQAVDSMPAFYQPQVLYNLLGDAYSQLKKTAQAEKWYKAALQAKPDHIPAHLTYGKLLAKNRTRVLEAEQWFLRAKQLAPTDSSVYQHFGQFLSELERHSEAAAHYVRAAELAPGEYEATVSAATALRQAGQKIEAERYYRQAAKIKPEDARSHSNLGAMLHLNGKYEEAAASYETALKFEPEDVTTLTNLHKLRSLVNKLAST